ncbi:MAG: hypothetical protein HKN24_15070 [Acidimicrobiales bacterium]|nr:hypothetical protein [Acidimicrobiales bacterium]
MSTPSVVNESASLPDVPGSNQDRRAHILAVLRLAAIPVGILIMVWALLGFPYGNGSSESSPVDLEQLGLSVSAEIQAGQWVEVTVPVPEDTVVAIGTVPEGVTATLTPATDGTMTLRVAPAADTPRGEYNLGLIATTDGDRQELSWPFRVADPDGS